MPLTASCWLCMQVESFVSLAAAAAAAAHVTCGSLQLLPSDPSSGTSSSSSSSTSTLLAAFLAKLAVGHPTLGVDTILLQQLMPQLLSCPALVLDGVTPAWVSSLCGAADVLAAAGHTGAAPLAVSAVAQLEELLAQQPSAGGALQLGAAACVQLLELLLMPRPGEQCQLQPALQQRLLTCVIPRLTTCGGLSGVALTTVCLQPAAADPMLLLPQHPRRGPWGPAPGPPHRTPDDSSCSCSSWGRTELCTAVAQPLRGCL